MWDILDSALYCDLLPRYGHTTPSPNSGTRSGAAASKRAATKRQNMRARSNK